MATKLKLSYPVLRDPFKHQLEGVSLGLKEDSLALFFEPRLGKTFTALLIAAMRFKAGQVKLLMVVVKKIFMDVWEEEAQELDIPYEVVRVEGKRTSRFKILGSVRGKIEGANRLTILLVNYEFLWRAFDDFLHMGIDMAVLDESRRIAGPTSKQATACHSLGDRIQYKIIMTANPLAEMGLDAWSQFRFLDPRVLGSDYTFFQARFAKTWTMKVPTKWGLKEVEKVVGIRNRETLIKLIQSKSIVRTQAECLDLPPMTIQDVCVPLSASSQKIHDFFGKTEDPTVDGVEIDKGISLQKMAKQNQITGGFLLQENKLLILGTEKLDALEELIDDHPKNWKFVIFTRYIHEIEAIIARLNKMKRFPMEVSGRTTEKNSNTIYNFQNRSRVTDLVCQAEMAALGLDFTASNTVIQYTPSMKYEMYYQGMQRVQGPKQKRPTITVFRLRCKGTGDDTLYKALEGKRDAEQYILQRHRRI